jgi:hypothetical protein
VELKLLCQDSGLRRSWSKLYLQYHDGSRQGHTSFCQLRCALWFLYLFPSLLQPLCLYSIHFKPTLVQNFQLNGTRIHFCGKKKSSGSWSVFLEIWLELFSLNNTLHVVALYFVNIIVLALAARINSFQQFFCEPCTLRFR